MSYTVGAEALTDEVLDLEVASCGDDRLTNRDLPYYYWQQYYSFASTYSSYAAYLIDTTKPFDQQMCVFDDTLTWQQYFLQGAVSTYKSVSALWQDARLSGFQLGEGGSGLSRRPEQYRHRLCGKLRLRKRRRLSAQNGLWPSRDHDRLPRFCRRYLTAARLQALVEAKTYTGPTSTPILMRTPIPTPPARSKRATSTW